MVREEKCAAGGKVMAPERSRDHPPINLCSHAEQQGSGTVPSGTLGIHEVVQQLFQTSVKVAPHKTIYSVNIILFTAVLPLLVNEICSTTNYDGN